MKKPFSYLLLEVQQEAYRLSKKLSIPVGDFEASTLRRIIVISDENREDLFNRLEEEGYERAPQMPGSSAGGVRKGKVEIIHKPKSAQKAGGHGKLNELEFQRGLERAFKEVGGPLDIILTDGERSVKAFGVSQVLDASRNQSENYDKADMDLLKDSNTVLGISIKKVNGDKWESSRKRFNELYENFMRKAHNGELRGLTLLQRSDAKTGVLRMVDDQGKNYGKVIVKKLPKNFYREIIFGPDHNRDHEVVVATQTFTKHHFKLEENRLTIQLEGLYTSVEEVEAAGKQPVLAFSHHRGKSNGIEIRSFQANTLPKKDSSANIYTIYYDELKD